MNPRNDFFSSILFIIAIFIVASCDESNLSRSISQKEIFADSYNLRSEGVHKNIEFDWENNSTIDIQDINVILPWYSGAPANLPEHIFTDYKKKDGWVMIYNFITDNKISMPNRNVLVFYNTFRGLMRIYYYNNTFPSQAGTSFAQIIIHDENTKLLNSSTVGRVCLPMDEEGSNTVFSAGISANPISGFYLGWNCFEVEMSYDEQLKNKSTTMSISFYDKKVSSIMLTGGLEIKGLASYITTTSSNPKGDFADGIFNSVASVAGRQVEQIVFPKNKSIKHEIQGPNSIGTAIIGSVISSAISQSINAITKSWTSSWSRSNSIIKDVDINLSGIVDLDGKITENIPPPIVPIQNILIPGSNPQSSALLPIYEDELGVWNLKTSKPVYIGDHVQPAIENYSHYPTHENDYPIIADINTYVYINTPNYGKDDIVLNEAVKSKIDKYEVETSIYYKKSSPGSISEDMLIDTYWGNSSEKYDLAFRDIRYHISNSYWLLMNSNDFQRDMTPSSYFDEKSVKFVAKVTLLLYPKEPFNTNVISLTRTFDVKQRKYQHLQRAEFILENQNSKNIMI